MASSKEGRDKGTFILLLEALAMKKLPRAGWIVELAPRESLADHSFSTALISLALARMEGLGEREEHALLRAALLHDLHEARVGDLSRLQRKYVRADYARAEKEMLGQTHFEEELRLLADEKLSPLVKDADKLDMLFQAIDYANAGNKNMERFIGAALEQIKSDSGKKLAKMALSRLKK